MISMKAILPFIFMSLISFTVYSQNFEEKYEAKVTSIDSIVTSIYEVVSGKKGEERDWELHRTIFHPEANIISNYVNEEGEYEILFNDVEGYIDTYSDYFKDNDLYEVDVNREVDVFGNMAHVLSTFESYNTPDEATPYKQGVASIQLYNDGERWWVLSMYYKNETETDKIPSEYLPSN